MSTSTKVAGAAAAGAVAVSALLVLNPSAPKVVNVSLACDAPPAGYEVCWYAGNRPGRYSLRVLGDASGSFTFTDLDPTLPWYFNATLYQPLAVPVTNCFAGKTGAGICRVISEIEGDRAGELADLLPTILPFIEVSGGIVALTGYGCAGSNYWVYRGESAESITLPVFSVNGSNAPWVYSEAAGNQAFFHTTVRVAPVNNSSTIP